MNNINKQLCATCKYRGRIGSSMSKADTSPNSICCDYLLITGRARILECYDPRDCTAYKQGKPPRLASIGWGNK